MSGAPEPILGTAILLGFVGSVHCLGMCGGIAAAMGQMVPEESVGLGWFRAGLYSLGRITSYSVAGAIVGRFGEIFSGLLGLSVALRIATGLLIIVFGLHVAGWWNGLAPIERIGLLAWRRLAPLVRRIGRPDRVWKTFALGMLWGWLPCGLVYAALLGASTTGSSLLGAGFMFCFGIGTMPALLAASGFGSSLGAFLKLRSARRAAGVLLMIFGLWSIAGAVMPMHGGSKGAPGHAHHMMK